MRVELPGIRHWRHDLTGCLHIAMAVLLRFYGVPPLEMLGAAWRWSLDPSDIRREEYYLPGRHPSLLAGLAPRLPLTSHWHRPDGAGDGWRAVREAIAGGTPVAVAVDNFHLPFRPAYRDVHSNHLIVVYGFDDEAGTARVADPVPPRYQGPLPIAALTAARDSSNGIAHDRDRFFTANPIGNRWLHIEVTGELPAFDRAFVTASVRANLAGFDAPDLAGEDGMDGLERFLAAIVARLGAGDGTAVDEAFIVAGPVLAATALHAEWLARAGQRFDNPAWTEGARLVDRVAHHWTAFRITVAHARTDPAGAAASAGRRAQALLADQRRALARLAEATWSPDGSVPSGELPT